VIVALLRCRRPDPTAVPVVLVEEVAVGALLVTLATGADESTGTFPADGHLIAPAFGGPRPRRIALGATGAGTAMRPGDGHPLKV
jgi:hypothetical protein